MSTQIMEAPATKGKQTPAPQKRSGKAAAAAKKTDNQPANDTARVEQNAKPERATPARTIASVNPIDKMDMTTLGGRMTWARLRTKTTQEDLAKTLGKSRATVVQYERDNIMPPLDVVEEVAKRLGVSPAFIAYGEHTVPGVNRSDIQTVLFAEKKVGKDGAYATSVFSFDQKLVQDELGVEDKDAMTAFIIGHDAPEFNVRSGDRLFVDASVKEPVQGRDLYVIKTNHGMEIVRVEPSLSSKADAKINMTGPRGQSLSGKLSDLEFLGAVVATLNRR